MMVNRQNLVVKAQIDDLQLFEHQEDHVCPGFSYWRYASVYAASESFDPQDVINATDCFILLSYILIKGR